MPWRPLLRLFGPSRPRLLAARRAAAAVLAVALPGLAPAQTPQELAAAALEKLRYDRPGCVLGDCERGIGLVQSLSGGLRLGFFVAGVQTEGLYLFDGGAFYLGQMFGTDRHGLGVEVRGDLAMTFKQSERGRANGRGLALDPAGLTACGTFDGGRWLQGATMDPVASPASSGHPRSLNCSYQLHRGKNVRFLASSTSVDAHSYDWEFQRPAEGFAITYWRKVRLQAGHHARVGAMLHLARGVEVDLRSAASRPAGRCPVLVGNWTRNEKGWTELHGQGLCFHPDTGMAWYGQLKNGVPDGPGEAVWPDGRRESGTWRAGAPVLPATPAPSAMPTPPPGSPAR